MNSQEGKWRMNKILKNFSREKRDSYCDKQINFGDEENVSLSFILIHAAES